jgi:hypothetical protein
MNDDEPQQTQPPQSNMSYTLNFTHGSTTLNSEQHTIVTADPFQHQRILASAGSGKTTTIAARIAWLLTNTTVTSDQIVLLTFSRNAAREMLTRVRRLVGPVSLWAGTFHALANTILRAYSDSASSSSLFFVDELPVRWMQWMRTDRGRKWVGRVKYIVVDEFQDINAIQWRLLETMRHIGARMIIVGDDAQNIYTWRGSSAGFLLDFHRLIPSVHDYQLRQNYRSTEAIVAVANRVMRGIPTLPWKEHMIAHTKGGVKPDVLFFWRASDEYLWLAKTLLELRRTVPHATVAVLARNNVELYRAEEVLLQNGVRTRFLVMERTGSDGEEESHNDASAHTKGAVDLATFHGSKGLEWDYTFCISLSDDTLPSKKTPNEIIGERRLFYVAVTRARQRMFLTYHGNERCLTRFVREIGYQQLTYHGLARYALSEFEVGGMTPSLQGLLDCLDGDDWHTVRSMNLLPWKEDDSDLPITTTRLFPNGESWKIPTWCDGRDFECFLRLWMKRCMLQLRGWREDYKDPLRERMIFTVRVFQEDREFWEQWREEFDGMIRHFFQDLQRMQPADYGDVAKWSEDRGLDWTQSQIVTATSILAKLRGQLRPLRFEKYSLDEFTIGPTRCVVPTEYRVEVLRSWRRLVRKDLGWRDILIDIWRLACLEQVAEGRHAGLFRVGAMIDYLQECIPFLERLEQMIQDSLLEEDTDDIIVNPEVTPDGLSPAGCDLLIGRQLIRICGEKKPDMYMWAETWLTSYLFVACGLCRPISRIQILHPFYGLLLSHEPVDLARARRLYEHLLGVWETKQA